MIDLEARFRRYLIEAIVAYLLGRSRASVEAETTLAVLPYGQITRGTKGDTFTPRQATLSPRPSRTTNIIRVGGIDYTGAVGDAQRHRARSRPMSRGGGAFPAPYLILPHPELAVIQKGIAHEGGVSPAFGGSFPKRYFFYNGPEDYFAIFTDLDNSVFTEGRYNIPNETEDELTITRKEQFYPANEVVQKVWQSRLYHPERPLIDYGDFGLLYIHVPQERPYATGLDEYGSYIASWPHWDYAEGPLYVKDMPGSSVSVSVVVGPQKLYWYQPDPDIEPADPEPYKEVWSRPAVSLGSATFSTHEVPQDELVYALRYRHHYTEVLTRQGEPLSRLTQRTKLEINATDTIESPYLEYADGGESNLYDWRAEQISAGAAAFFLTKRTENYKIAVGFGAYAFATSDLRAGFWEDGEEDYENGEVPIFNDGTFPNIEDDGRHPVDANDPSYGGGVGQTESYRVGGYSNVTDWGGGEIDIMGPTPEREFEGPFNGTVRAYPDGFANLTAQEDDVRQVQSLLLELNAQQRSAINPYWQGWPETPTPESRAEVALLTPYIFGHAEDDPPSPPQPPYDGLSDGPPADPLHASERQRFIATYRLANPTGPLGSESSWFGLSWTSGEYVCDAFYADEPNPETGALETHLYAVAIFKDESFTVVVSRDEVKVGEWPLELFFPVLARGEQLKHLDGTLWPPDEGLSLRPSYSYLHPGWPFRDAAYLAPFGARMKLLLDKGLPADAPVLITLESEGRDFDPPAPAYREFAVRSGEAVIESVSDPDTPVDAALLAQLTSPFTPGDKPRALLSSAGFRVRVNLGAVALPYKYRVKLYLYVLGGAALAPVSYNPSVPPPKSKVWRLAPSYTLASADFTLPERPEVHELEVSLPTVSAIARMHVVVKGLANDAEPLYAGFLV